MVTPVNEKVVEYRGLSSDEKPINNIIGNGSLFIEMDTGNVFFFDKENYTWLQFNGTFCIR